MFVESKIYKSILSDRRPYLMIDFRSFVGDHITIEEWDGDKYTGRQMVVEVFCISNVGDPGLVGRYWIVEFRILSKV
jgi:hypothetical protein